MVERTIILTNKDASGNTTMDFPITKAENVEGIEKVGSLPVGHRYLHWGSSVPVGKLPAVGALYNRELYADLWQYAQDNGEVITEEEWQTQASANGGNCAFFSDGNGSTTFRVPSMKCWVKGASGIEEVGSFLEAGLPNIEGTAILNTPSSMVEEVSVGALDGVISQKSYQYDIANGTYYGADVRLDASKSNAIYGNSDTVQPPSLVGMWVIVAYGVIHTSGTLDLDGVAEAIGQVQTDLNNKVNTDDVIDLLHGGTGATTASEALENLGALPLSGGILTGKLQVITTPYGDETTTSISGDGKGEVRITGGTSIDNGGSIFLYPDDIEGYEEALDDIGAIVLRPSGNSWLKLSDEGGMIWNSVPVLRDGLLTMIYVSGGSQAIYLPDGGTWAGMIVVSAVSNNYCTAIPFSGVAGGSICHTTASNANSACAIIWRTQ